MKKFDGKIVCGRRGGSPFLTAIRPDPITKLCPDNYEPCSSFTSVENTICYTLDKSNCPIT